MSDNIVDLTAERLARSSETDAGAVTVTGTLAGISLRLGKGDDGMEASLDESGANRLVANLQRAVEAHMWANGIVRVPLGKSGRFALVDAEDADRVRQFRWRLKAKKSQPGKFYAQRSLPRSERSTITNQTLHAFVLGLPSSQYIDHWDGDGLNNTRRNLRPCTPRQNATNVTSSKRQKLGGYKGVTWNKAAAKWQASICAGEIKPNGKRRQLYLGVFEDPIKAARAYDAKAREVFGEFANLNFPDAERGHLTTRVRAMETDASRRRQ